MVPALALFIGGCGLLLTRGESSRLGFTLTALAPVVSVLGLVLATWLYPRRPPK